jgi:hypothetical protein
MNVREIMQNLLVRAAEVTRSNQVTYISFFFEPCKRLACINIEEGKAPKWLKSYRRTKTARRPRPQTGKATTTSPQKTKQKNNSN